MANTDIRERPPRYLSLFTRIRLLFGGFSVLFGSAFFWFGMLFTVIFVGNSTVMYWPYYLKEWKTTTGVLTSRDVTNTEVNNQNIYAYNYRYDVGGKSFESVSYDYYKDIPKNVSVEYCVSNPEVSVIEGMDMASMPAFVLFVLLFPIIGFSFMCFGFYLNFNAMRLFEFGQFTRGTLVNSRFTNTRINDRAVKEYEFEFQAGHVTYKASCKTHLYENVEDEAKEIILYDKADPDKSVVFDSIETAPKIDKFGNFEQASLFSAVLYLLPHLIGLGISTLLFLFVKI